MNDPQNTTRIIFGLQEFIAMFCSLVVMYVIIYYSRMIDNEGDKNKTIDDLIRYTGFFILVLAIGQIVSIGLLFKELVFQVK